MCKPGQPCGTSSRGRGSIGSSGLGAILALLAGVGEHVREATTEQDHEAFIKSSLDRAKVSLGATQLSIEYFSNPLRDGKKLVHFETAALPDPDREAYYVIAMYGNAEETSFTTIGKWHGAAAPAVDEEVYEAPTHEIAHGFVEHLQEHASAEFSKLMPEPAEA